MQKLIIAVFILALTSCITLKKHNKLMQEYQIKLEPNTFYLYDHSRLVGYGPYGQDGIDSVLLDDNL